MILALTCQRCGHQWKANAARDVPANCAHPNCKAGVWDMPRKYKLTPKNKPPLGGKAKDGLFGE